MGYTSVIVFPFLHVYEIIRTDSCCPPLAEGRVLLDESTLIRREERGREDGEGCLPAAFCWTLEENFVWLTPSGEMASEASKTGRWFFALRGMPKLSRFAVVWAHVE